jgi:TonB-linked SusC/RagA family outer membrane protein
MRICLLVLLIAIQLSAKGSLNESSIIIRKNQFPPDSSGNNSNKDSLLSLGHYQVNPELHSSSLFILQGDKTGNGMSVSLPQSITGKIPGLFVIPGDFQTGNESYLFLVRGRNSFNYSNPLFVVDGIPDRDITTIDANDIQTISLLKDGTAAIYGAQSSNGVLFINTKQGKPGKPSLTIKLNQGFNQPARVPEMADAVTYATMQNEIFEYASGIKNGIYSTAELQKFRDGSDPLRYPNTDWFNSVYKKVSWQNSVYASLNGGAKHFNYFVSAGTKYQDGIFKNSASNSTLNHIRANLEGKISIITVNVNLGYQQQICNSPAVPTSDVFGNIFSAKPTMLDFWPGNKPSVGADYGFNPAVITTNVIGTNKLIRNYFQNSARLSIDIPFIAGLKLNALYSYDLNRGNQTIDKKPWTLYSWDGISYDSQQNPILISSNHGSLGLQHSLYRNLKDKRNLILDFSYIKNYSQLSAILTGGIERQDINYNDSKDYWSYNGSTIDSLSISTYNSGSDSHMINYFACLNLKFFQHYLLEFTASLPKSGILAVKNSSHLFGSASLAWLISDELFWKGIFGSDYIFQIHGSIGKTGTDNAQILNSGIYLGLPNTNVIANPNVNWELETQSNIGFTETVLGSKLSIEADYFYNFRSQILMQPNLPLPPSGGFITPLENIGKVSNKGFEFMLTYHDDIGAGLKYSISINGSYAINKVVYFDETPGLPKLQQMTRQPMGSSLYYQAMGVFKDSADVVSHAHWPGARPGDIRFKDINGDNQINASDRVRIDKNIFPRFQGGINIDIHYRQLGLTMFIQGATGGVVDISPESGTVSNYFEEYAVNRWTSSNQSTTYPRAWNRQNEYWMSNPNTFWLRSTDYIRLKNVELGYSLKGKILQKFKMQQFRIYLDGFNLFTLDKLRLIDPEIPYTSSYYGYPVCRYFNIGLSCTF